MADEMFKVELADGVARCSMNGPNMNALGEELGRAVADGLRQVLSDESVRVIVLRGEGGNFCAGADLKMLGVNTDPLALSSMMRLVNGALYDLHEGPKPVIAEVDGYAVGGGFALALAADIIYATERAQFSMIWIRIGAVPDLGCPYFLSERIGLGRAKELAFTGDMIDAKKAQRMGIVDHVLPAEAISEEVLALAKRLARRPAAALAWTKHAMNAGGRSDLRTVLDLEAHVQPLMLLSEEHRQAVAKFFTH